MKKNVWLDYIIEIENKILTTSILKQSLTNFWDFINLNLSSSDQLLLIQFKILDEKNQYNSISYLQHVNMNEFEKLFEIFTEFWAIKDEWYHSLKIKSIIFTYKIINNDLKITTSKFTRSKTINAPKFTFKGISLPSTMDFTTWGIVLFNDYTNAIIEKPNSKAEYHITVK